MRILMTGKAIFQFEMGFPFMTHGALGNNFFLGDAGGVATSMAVKATYFGFVFCSIVHVLMGNFCVAFDTVAVFKHRICSPGIAR